MEVLTEVGWILCWRDRELWLFYRELRWRMVKMVRNAYEMAIPEKNGRFFFEKNRWKNEKWLEMGRQTSFSSSDYRVLKQFFETNRLVIVPGGQTWLKKSFWRVRGVKHFPIFLGGRIQNRRPHFELIWAALFTFCKSHFWRPIRCLARGRLCSRRVLSLFAAVSLWPTTNNTWGRLFCIRAPLKIGKKIDRPNPSKRFF